MTNEERTDWIRKNYKSLGIELKAGTIIEYDDTILGITSNGFVQFETIECSGLSTVAGTYNSGKITLYKSAFERSFAYVQGSDVNGVLSLSTNLVRDGGPMGKAIFTFGHEAAH
jgi:hypothetical protein